ncbi:MAG: helix-turn-helix domain-containing protein [Erysipelotrichaceae bacterium]
MEQLLQLMKKYNFTEYETKAYVTLLQNGKCNGYEVSKLSSVPRSKIYNVLESLFMKGLVNKIIDEQTSYIALPIEQFIKSLENKMHNDLKEINHNLILFNQPLYQNEELINIKGYQNVINKAKYLVNQAQNELLIQLWEQDVDEELLALLQEAENRIDKYILILFSEEEQYNLPLKRYYKHHFEKEKLQENNSKWLNIVSDNEMLMSTIYSSSVASAITTKFTPMVFLSKEYIIHDAYTANILEILDNQNLEVFGTNMSKIRDIYKNK